MRERFKQIRKSLGLSQADFGAKLGLTQAAITDIERGKSSITERNFNSVCRIFNINPEWLETGKGEMLQSPDKTFLDQLAEEKHLNSRTKALIGSIIELPPDVRDNVIDWFLSLARGIENQQLAAAQK